jgi:hypothetical protein
MTGVDIIGALLRADANLIAAVPVERIKAARLPDGIVLPALVVTFTSGVERQTLKREAVTRTTDRISVTVRAANERDRASVIGLVVKACAGLTGNIGGGSSVSILTAGRGPYLSGPGDTYEQTQDFRVSYDA